jgi:hypothetical protein
MVEAEHAQAIAQLASPATLQTTRVASRVALETAQWLEVQHAVRR